VLLRSLVSAGGRLDNARFIPDYRHFMLRPGSHNDSCRADAALKLAFERWAAAGCVQDDTICKGGLADYAVEESTVWSVNNVSSLLRTALLAILLGSGGGGDSGGSPAAVERVAREHERLTHNKPRRWTATACR
jgi:hypothetical protein